MPRMKTFTVEDVLKAALDVFGERGYHDTSMQDVARRLGRSRSSIYVTFRDKDNLFSEVLRRYLAEDHAPGLAALRGGGSPRAAIVSAFEWPFSGSNGTQPPSLLFNAALALASTGTPSSEVAQVVQDMLGDLELCFREAVERGQAAAEIAGGLDAADTGRVLLSLYFGLCVLVRAGVGEPVLRAVSQHVQSLLLAPP